MGKINNKIKKILKKNNLGITGFNTEICDDVLYVKLYYESYETSAGRNEIFKTFYDVFKPCGFSANQGVTEYFDNKEICYRYKKIK